MSKKEWRVYVEDTLESIALIQRYIIRSRIPAPSAYDHAGVAFGRGGGRAEDGSGDGSELRFPLCGSVRIW